MYGDPSNSASSGASLSLSGQRSQSLSQSQTSSSSSYPPPIPLSLTSSRTSPYAPNPIATTSSTSTTAATAVAPPTTTSMAASVFYPPPQPIGPPGSAQPSYPSSFPYSSDPRDAPNPIGARPAAIDYAVIVRRLQPDTTEEQLRIMCTFSDELVDVDMMVPTTEDEANWPSAILRFKSLDGAREAKRILNGKKGMLVDHLNPRGRASGPSSSGASSATSPATAATQPPRFDGPFSPLEKSSPPINGNYVTSDFGSAKPNYNYNAIFSPQSPIGNHFSEQPRVTGKSLINDATDDDDTGDILQLPRAFGENGSVTSQRRATAPHLPILSGMSSLSLNTVPTNGVSASQRGHSGMYPPLSAHPTTMSPGTMNGTGGSYPMNSMGWRTHAPPPANPADQNPPCNTLYVGNLPMGTSEDELKAIFSRQRGYKRLCFRAKSNGPMCFVEFEDVSFATKALHDLYGIQLTNSVKGGIRLSFSKNPLGVRTAQPPGQGPSGPLGGPNGLLGPSATGFTPAGPPPGLAAPPGLNANRTNGPYTAATMPNGSSAANGSSSYPPSTVPNGTGNPALSFGNGLSGFGSNTWGSNGYFSSAMSPPPSSVASPPLSGHPSGSATFGTFRRGQF